MKRLLMVWPLVCVLVAAPASAQLVGEPPAVSVGVGLGAANPLHGDFGFIAWAWETDARIRLSSSMLVEAAVGDWRHDDHYSTTTAPGIDRVDQRTNRTQRSWQVNLLHSVMAGRAAVVVGGGVGWLQHRRRTVTTLDGCTNGVTCGTFESTVSNGDATAQATGGVELRLSRHVSASATGRFIVPLRDPGGADLRGAGGLRWRF